MKISFDVQPLLDSGKTGVAYSEAGLVGALTSDYPDDTFVFEFFSSKSKKENERLIRSYMKENCITSTCDWFPAKLFRMLWPFIPIPYSLFFNNKSDITHFFNFTIPPFVQGKKVVTIHDMAFMAYPETVRTRTKYILKLTIKKTIKRADKIIAVSEFSKQELMKYFSVPAEKVEVVYNAVDADLYNSSISAAAVDEVKGKYGIKGDYFLYLGTLEPRKNLERLITAYSKFIEGKKEYPKLVLAGKKGWFYESIFDKVRELKLGDDIIFTDYIPQEDAPLLMNGALAFCFPSLYEGFGMPPLEAMACGTPVLTSDCSSLPEVVGDCAVLIDPLSEESIASGMEKLYSDRALRESLSLKGVSRAADFTWGKFAEKLYDIYRGLFDEKN